MVRITSMVQALPPELRSMLGPSYQALSETRRFLDNYASTNQNNSGNNNYYSNSNSQQSTIPADYAAYMQNMGNYMQNMYGMMQQMAVVLQALLANNNLDLSSLSDEDQQFLQDNFGGSIGQNPRQNAYNAVLEAIKKTGTETDSDNDGAAISADDVNSIKQAIEDEEFGKPELKEALAYVLIKASDKKTDEVLDLISQCEDKGLVDVEAFLEPRLLGQLSSKRRGLVSDMIANKGLADPNGKPYTKLAGILLDGITYERPAAYNTYTKGIVKKMVGKWLLPTPASNSKDKDYLVNLLSLAGFVFKADGSLDDDSKQPFPVQT